MSTLKSFSFPNGDIRGDMFYIKHNSENFTIIDCYLKDGDDENCRKDEIIQEIVSESRGRITRFISTHPDNDHILGLNALDDKLSLTNFYAVENDIPADDSDDSLKRYLKLKSEHNYAIEKGINRAWLNKKTEERKSSGLNFHWPVLSNEKFKKELKNVAKGESPNNISCILTYEIESGASYMWMGDMETDMQQEYYENCKSSIPSIDILFQPHHGRKSGSVPNELLESLSPKLIIIGNAPSEYIDYGDSQQTITQNTAGDIIFENGYKEVDVYTQHKIDNKPTCLKNKGKANINSHGVTFHYCGTLEL